MENKPIVGGAITSKNLPPQATNPPIQEVVISDDQIVAKPLRAPNFINLQPVNKAMSIYWGNYSVGEKESCMRFDQLIAMGFVPAKPDDVYSTNHLGQKLPCPPSLQKNGRVIYGDTILLKIPRVDFVGALKWNEQSARHRVKKPGVAISGGASKDLGGKEVLKTDEGRRPLTSAAFPNSPKITPYVPQLAEVDAKTADNSGPDGEVNLATK